MMGRISRDNLVLFGLLAGLSTMMILFILMPLWAMLAKSVQNSDGEFVGLANLRLIFLLQACGFPLVILYWDSL